MRRWIWVLVAISTVVAISIAVALHLFKEDKPQMAQCTALELDSIKQTIEATFPGLVIEEIISTSCSARLPGVDASSTTELRTAGAFPASFELVSADALMIDGTPMFFDMALPVADAYETATGWSNEWNARVVLIRARGADTIFATILELL